MGRYPNLGRLVGDAAFWAFCMIVLGVMSAAGLVTDPAFALAGAAFWWGIRARTMAEVNTAHKNSEEV